MEGAGARARRWAYKVGASRTKKASVAKLSGLRRSPRGQQRPHHWDDGFLLPSTLKEKLLEDFKQEWIQSLRGDT